MRDFRDAKAMARTMRAELAAKGLKITVSESLELVAKAFGLADWNRLAAAIQSPPDRDIASAPSLPAVKSRVAAGTFGSAEKKAVEIADERQHEYVTLEHLLFSLTDDPEAVEVMLACGVDLSALKKGLSDYLDTEMQSLRRAEPHAELTASAQRLLDRAAIPGRPDMPPGQRCVTSINVMLAILSEADSYASYFLRQQGMSPQAAAKFRQQEPPPSNLEKLEPLPPGGAFRVY